MPINCPQCGTAMAELSATQAQCAKHGPYAILFKRSAVDDGTIPLAQSATQPPPRPPGARPYAAAQQYTPYAQAVPVAQLALGPCQNHQQVAAVQRCSRCAARICAVCDFPFPGEIHLCPRCVTSAAGAISPGRKGMVYGAFGAAATATLTFAAFIFAAASGAFGGASQIAAIAIFVFLIACITTGLGLGLGVIDRQLNNPISVWIAAIWNGVLALGFVLMMIVGLMMKHR
jgi:hypothetical protein